MRATVGTGDTAESTDQTVTITIGDVDEVPTEFSISTTSKNVFETANGLKLADITITDDALGTNRIMLSDNDIFEIRLGDQLWLKENAPIDYETATSHTVTLTLVTTGEGTNTLGTLTFTLNLKAVDEAPEFGTAPTDLTITENNNRVGNPLNIVTISATDPDPEDAGKTIRFELVGAPAGFKIGETTGQITYEGTGLDYETTPTITLRVRAATQGDPRSRTQDVTITVTDIDEKATEFSLTQNSQTVSETSGARKLADIRFTDDALGVNRVFLSDTTRFEIRGGNELWLKAGVLDFETKTSHSVTLTPETTGTGPNTLQPITFTLTVTNVNEAPEFGAAPTGLTITENDNRIGNPLNIVQIQATDPEGADVKYELVNPPIGFAIDPITGQISYAGGGLDREAPNGESVTLTVKASDKAQGGLSSTQQITIAVTNVDEPPEFGTAPESLTINEKQDRIGAGDVLTLALANTQNSEATIVTDFAKGDQIEVATASGTQTRLRTLQSEANIRYTQDSDYSSIEGLTAADTNDPNIHDTIIYDTQGTEDTSDDVVLMVLEDYNTALTFADFIVAQATPITIGTVSAMDPEDSEIAVTYALVNPPAGFVIDPTTGQISYQGAGLNHETTPTITLKVQATAGGLSSLQEVTITVADRNEAPEYKHSSLAYNQGEIVVVLDSSNLLITDVDASDGPGELYYYMTAQSSAGKLQILNDHDNNPATDLIWQDINTIAVGRFSERFTAFTQADINAGRVRYVPNDPQAIADTSFTFSILDDGEHGVRAATESITYTLKISVREVLTVAAPEDSDEIDLDDTGTAGRAKQVDTGNGLDTIRTGTGNDQIDGGRGSDDISLQNNEGEEGGADEVIYRFSIDSDGDWIAYGGADRITGFTRGEDKIVFQID
ncbi:MAG: cadherin domain-containing protein, partial [Alphaproteobacteria bacterium]|nr:cadherin domain-containing protein [Alphaproteobacteria bacterium]